MRRLVLVSLALGAVALMGPARLLAQSPEADVMAAANQLYESSRFAEAAEAYQSLVDGGFESADLYYNLGNAHFKLGEVGGAILNYQRAARIAPRDSDIKANLEIARSQTVDKLDRSDEQVFSRATDLVRSWTSPTQSAVASLGTWAALLLMGAAIVYLGPGPLRRTLGYASVVASVLLLLGVVSLWSHLYADRDRNDAVVLASEVDVLSGPGQQYIIEFSLHSGAELKVIETRESWARVSLPGGELQGWVPKGAVAMVSLSD